MRERERERERERGREGERERGREGGRDLNPRDKLALFFNLLRKYKRRQYKTHTIRDREKV